MRVRWDAPFNNSSVSYHLISARSLNDTGRDLVTNTSTNNTFFSVTSLLPGTTYELTVVAVSQGGDIIAESQASESVISTTGFTGQWCMNVHPRVELTNVKFIIIILWLAVPAPTCSAPVSSNGLITVTWSYIHTGGLPLTSVSVVYRFEEGLSLSPPMEVEIANTEVTTAAVMDLVAGRLYTFTITAENSNGSSSIVCDPVRHDVGEQV